MYNNNATEKTENDLKLIHDLSVNWKMVFNPDTNKPAEEVLFTNPACIPWESLLMNISTWA